MNKLSFAALLLCLAIAAGCHDFDSDDVNIAVPAPVQNFIANNYPGQSIEDSGLEDLCDSVVVYKVELENGADPDTDLYFDLSWNFLFKSTDIANSTLPAAVLAAIQTQFAGYVLSADDSERHDFPDGSVQYKVELKDSTGKEQEVVFSADGAVVCSEADHHNDDDDDDDHGDDDDNNGQPANIPANVLNDISGTYPGYQVQEAHLEDLCDDTDVYEVELEHGPGPDTDLYYDLNWVFLFKSTDISNSALPAAVLAAIQAQFAGYVISADDSERHDFPDGSVQYKVELKNNNGSSDVELILNADGSIACTDN